MQKEKPAFEVIPNWPVYSPEKPRQHLKGSNLTPRNRACAPHKCTIAMKYQQM
jgi:hypothetical protein